MTLSQGTYYAPFVVYTDYSKVNLSKCSILRFPASQYVFRGSQPTQYYHVHRAIPIALRLASLLPSIYLCVVDTKRAQQAAGHYAASHRAATMQPRSDF
jgi:hypothetical protein